MSKRRFELETGQFVFMSYAHDDRARIFDLGIVQRLATAEIVVRIDKEDDRSSGWGWDAATEPFVDHFRYGVSWQQQIIDGAGRALCVLALCSTQTLSRLREGGHEAWIARELKAGRDNSTLLVVSIDDNLDLTTSNAAEQAVWQTHLGPNFADAQLVNLGTLRRNDRRAGTRSMEKALDALVEGVRSRMKQALQRSDHSTRLNVGQVRRLLNCLDRERQARQVAQNHTFHLAETAERSAYHSFMDRLTFVDLPDHEHCRRDSSRATLADELRYSQLVQGKGPECPQWAIRGLSWPRGEGLSTDEIALGVLREIGEHLDVTSKFFTLDFEATCRTIKECLSARAACVQQPSAYLFWLSSIDEEATQLRIGQAIVRLEEALDKVASPWIRVILFLHEPPVRRGLLGFGRVPGKRAVAHALRLRNDQRSRQILNLGRVRVADLSRWRDLAANFVQHDAALIGDALRGMYRKELGVADDRAIDEAELPMDLLRERLEPLVATWPTRQRLW